MTWLGISAAQANETKMELQSFSICCIRATESIFRIQVLDKIVNKRLIVVFIIAFLVVFVNVVIVIKEILKLSLP